MAKASDNPFPSVLLVEGSAPASPASGDQRVFLDVADHKLKRVNSSGTVTTIESGGGGSLEVTDGTTDLTGVTKITTTGLVVGGTAGASTLQSHMVQLGKIDVGVGGSALSFTSIPSGYRALMLLVMGRSTSTSAWGTFRFNSDSSASYDVADTAYQGANGGANLNGQTAFRGIYLNGTDAVANFPSSTTILIHNYDATSFYKTLTATTSGADSGNMLVAAIAATWRSTSAITRIDSVDTYAQNSRAELYGLY